MIRPKIEKVNTQLDIQEPMTKWNQTYNINHMSLDKQRMHKLVDLPIGYMLKVGKKTIHHTKKIYY